MTNTPVRVAVLGAGSRGQGFGQILAELPHLAQVVAVAEPRDAYGRCVFQCDNGVVDHQVVALDFEGDITATFTMTAFTQHGGRKIRVHGTEGELRFDEHTITVRSFRTNNVETIAIVPEVGGHGGGDNRVVRDWLEAIRLQAPEKIRAFAQESLRTHKIVFAAERSRREKRTIELTEM